MRILLLFLIFIYSCSSHNIQIPDIKSSNNFEWWKIFNDEKLNSIINTAIKNNFDIKIQEKNIEIARGNYYIERSSLLPFLSLSGSTVGYKRYLRGLPKFIPSKIKESEYNLSIDLNYEIDFWQKNYLKTKSKKDIENIEKLKMQIIEKSLISDVCSIYFEIKKNYKIKRILNSILITYKNDFDVLKKKFLKNEISIENLNKIKIQIENIKEKIILINNSNEILISSLNYLLGKKPENVLKINPEFKFLKLNIPEKVNSKMLLNRPDIQVSLNSIILNKKLVKIAKTNFFPDFYLITSYGYNSGKLSDLIKNYNSLYNLTFNFLQSIFDFGKRKNLVRISEKQLEIANINFSNTMYKALKEVHQSISLYKNLMDRRKQILKEIKNLNNILNSLTEKFENGFIPIEKLYELKINILQKKIELINTEKDIYDSIIKTYKALGY